MTAHEAVRGQKFGLDRADVARLALERYRPGHPYWCTSGGATEILGVSISRVHKLIDRGIPAIQHAATGTSAATSSRSSQTPATPASAAEHLAHRCREGFTAGAERGQHGWVTVFGERRATLGEAQGMLMEVFGCTATQAMLYLVVCSMDQERTLHDVAAEFVETRALPHLTRRDGAP